MTMERRFTSGAELRADDSGAISGHAAVFNQEYVLWDSPGYRVVETVKPGTFKRALREKQDVVCAFNHSPDHILGRSSAGTLSMSEDDTGLAFTNTPPDTQLGRDLVTLIKRKDLRGCSFAFTVTKDTVTEETVDGQTIRTRQIEDVDLYDVGPVTYPAYTGTDVSARAKEMRAQLFPAGVPARVLELVPELRDSDSEAKDCRCGCRACFSADCDECEMHMQACGDSNYCSHSDASRSASRDDGKPTKRVDNEDLTADCFIYVGDPKKPETWALPWKFKSDEKKKTHLQNALARFNQTKKIPADKKAAAWKKLVRLCKKYGIQVSDEESNAWNLTAEQRADLARGMVGGGEDCQCACPECQVGDCTNCSEEGCEDPDCDHTGEGDQDGDDRADLAYIDGRLFDAGMRPPE